MQNSPSENAVFPLGAFWGHWICCVDETGEAQGGALMYMPHFGTEAVAVFRSFSSVHVLIVHKRSCAYGHPFLPVPGQCCPPAATRQHHQASGCTQRHYPLPILTIYTIPYRTPPTPTSPIAVKQVLSDTAIVCYLKYLISLLSDPYCKNRSIIWTHEHLFCHLWNFEWYRGQKTSRENLYRTADNRISRSEDIEPWDSLCSTRYSTRTTLTCPTAESWESPEKPKQSYPQDCTIYISATLLLTESTKIVRSTSPIAEISPGGIHYTQSVVCAISALFCGHCWVVYGISTGRPCFCSAHFICWKTVMCCHFLKDQWSKVWLGIAGHIIQTPLFMELQN